MEQTKMTPKSKQNRTMQIKITKHGAYQVLRFHEAPAVIDDLTELRYLVKGYIDQGKRHIAVSFTDASYFYSGALGVLVECYLELKDGEGELCVIEPNQKLKDVFKAVNLDKIFKVYESENDLPD
jgi:anti-anti-sigma factor